MDSEVGGDQDLWEYSILKYYVIIKYYNMMFKCIFVTQKGGHCY